MEAMPNSVSKPITEDPIQNRRKGAKTSNEGNDKIKEQNSHGKIENSVNSRIKLGMKGKEHNYKELKLKSGGN